MSGFKLPDFPQDLVLRSAPKMMPKPRERSRTESGLERPSLLKPSSFKKPGGKKEGSGASLLTGLFDFYDEALKTTERLLQTVQDEATVTKAKESLARSKIAPGLRDKMTAETFKVKAEAVLTLMQRLELKQSATLQPPPTKPKQKHDNKPGVGRLSRVQRQLNIQSTIMAAQLQRYDLPSTSPRDKELGGGYAIPLCLPNDMEWNQQTRKCTRVEGAIRKFLVLNPQAVDILRSISGPVCVVAIVGPCRSGKSYILSRLISSNGGKCHFDLGHEFDPKTMGIWMWDQPFKLKLKNGEEVTMVLLDTEGIDAANATEQGDNQIFTLSVLLSSLLIYNSMSVPRREDLNQMHYIANLSKSIQVQTGKSAAGEEGVQLAGCNPRFMWLLRDVILEPTDRNGKPCHVKDYLLQKVLVEDMAGDEAQKSIRRCLLSFFSAFDSETLPPPSTDPNVMRNIENPLYQQDISPMFLQKTQYVRKRILDNCTAKRGFTGGSVVSGFQIAQLAQLYVEALNSPEGVPVVGSTWQRVLEATYTDGMEKAIMSYGDIMGKEMKSLPMENEQLLEHHQRAVDESLKSFQRAAALDTESELYQIYLDKLMTQLADYGPDGNCTGGLLVLHLQENYNKSQTSCQALLHGLKEKHLSPLISHLTPKTNFQAIEKAFTTMLSVYNEQSVGPAADDVLQIFLEEQEKERELLEDRLTTIKNYDAEATQRMKELRESQLHIEKKERESRELQQKMVQSRRDHEAKLKAMENKFSQDADKLRKESTQKLEEQERRLRNMADAKLEDVRSQNEAQLNSLRDQLRAKESQLQVNNARIQQEIERQRAETERLRQQASTRKKKKGCFAAGTMVTRTDGSELAIEKQMAGIKVLAIGGEVTMITDEYVENDLEMGQQLFGINDDMPFATLPHPFWTTEGWKCLDPDFAKGENPSTDFKLLQVGDTVFRISQMDPLLYKPVKIHKFTFTTPAEPIKIYGLHLDGPRSYHANGYIVAANYPVLTKKRVEEGMKKLSEEENDRLKLAITSAQHELSKVLGSWAKSAFQDMGLVHKENLRDE